MEVILNGCTFLTLWNIAKNGGVVEYTLGGAEPPFLVAPPNLFIQFHPCSFFTFFSRSDKNYRFTDRINAADKSLKNSEFFFFVQRNSFAENFVIKQLLFKKDNFADGGVKQVEM